MSVCWRCLSVPPEAVCFVPFGFISHLFATRQRFRHASSVLRVSGCAVSQVSLALLSSAAISAGGRHLGSRTSDVHSDPFPVASVVSRVLVSFRCSRSRPVALSLPALGLSVAVVRGGDGFSLTFLRLHEDTWLYVVLHGFKGYKRVHV